MPRHPDGRGVETHEQYHLWIGTPTWSNHIPRLGSADFEIAEYPYYDTATREVNIDLMLETLRHVPAGDVVLLHGCCHNPTGADLGNAQWDQITDIALERGFVPFIDTAYQGLGDDLDEDACGMRLMAEKLPELVLASSCSKNFGLYRKRTLLADSIQDNAVGLDLSHIKRQNGMFSFLGIAIEHLLRLREEFGALILLIYQAWE